MSGYGGASWHDGLELGLDVDKGKFVKEVDGTVWDEIWTMWDLGEVSRVYG